MALDKGCLFVVALLLSGALAAPQTRPILVKEPVAESAGSVSKPQQYLQSRMTPVFENLPPHYIGSNYAISGFPPQEEANYPQRPVSTLYTSILQGLEGKPEKSNEDTINDMFASAFKKYNVKKILLKKILGNSHDFDEDEGGFFSNKHLKRHGTAGVAAKVLGELIGIKIRESIEGVGKSVSEYAKDFTSRNFVNMGHLFARMFRIK